MHAADEGSRRPRSDWAGPVRRGVRRRRVPGAAVLCGRPTSPEGVSRRCVRRGRSRPRRRGRPPNRSSRRPTSRRDRSCHRARTEPDHRYGATGLWPPVRVLWRRVAARLVPRGGHRGRTRAARSPSRGWWARGGPPRPVPTGLGDDDTRLRSRGSHRDVSPGHSAYVTLPHDGHGDLFRRGTPRSKTVHPFVPKSYVRMTSPNRLFGLSPKAPNAAAALSGEELGLFPDAHAAVSSLASGSPSRAAMNADNGRMPDWRKEP